jgi:hypothetical protein
MIFKKYSGFFCHPEIISGAIGRKVHRSTTSFYMSDPRGYCNFYLQFEEVRELLLAVILERHNKEGDQEMFGQISSWITLAKDPTMPL